jgi:hypothetical protein
MPSVSGSRRKSSDSEDRPRSAPRTDRSPAAAIWISGLGAQGIEEGLEDVAKRIAFACDRRDIPEPTFSVRTAIKPEQVGEKLQVPRCTVLRTDASGTKPVLDLYGLGTAQTIIGDRAERSLLHQLWYAVRAVGRSWRKAARTRKRKRGKTKRERSQLLYARIWLALMVVGLILLLGLLASTLAVGDLPAGLRLLEGAILFIGGLSIWKSPLARKLGNTALIGYSVVDYLDRSDDKGSQLRGQLASLLEHLAERKHHRTVDVLAYSFGSIVAIDALFPYVQEPPPRLATIDRLITIACPFDFVRSYWPGYFTKRFSREDAPGRWVNFYAPSDVLASNFRDDSRLEEADERVEVREGQPPPCDPDNVAYLIDGREEPVSGKDALLLKGLRFHAQYWSSRVASEEAVFDQVVGHLGNTGAPQPVAREPVAH